MVTCSQCCSILGHRQPVHCFLRYTHSFSTCDALQEEQELAERVEADIQACSNRIRQKYEETRHTRWTAKIREGAWVKRQIAHTLQKRGYEAAQQAMYNLEQTLYQFDVVHRPQPDNPDATCISGKGTGPPCLCIHSVLHASYLLLPANQQLYSKSYTHG